MPLTPQDPRGLSLFYLVFGITLGAFIFGQTSHLYGKRLSAYGKLAQVLSFAVPVGLIGAVIAHTWIRVLPGPLLAIAGVLALLALAVGLLTVALTELLGDPGIAIATLIAVILGTWSQAARPQPTSCPTTSGSSRRHCLPGPPRRPCDTWATSTVRPPAGRCSCSPGGRSRPRSSPACWYDAATGG